MMIMIKTQYIQASLTGGESNRGGDNVNVQVLTKIR